ncbi:unnamed protein product [Penicillium salamii]|nr:unnamed protein product [Penicillium salamii]
MFTTSLKGDQYTKSPVDLHSNHLSVPCIIKCIFGKSVRLSDVCKVLRCNFDIARKSFAKWYLEPFGSDVMDDSERQRLFSPMTQFTLHGEADYRTEIQIGRDSQPKRGSLREAQKRRRISSGTSSNLEEDLSPIPNLSANAQVQTTLDECPEHSLLNQSGSGFSATQETAALPSTSPDHCLPPFSYITGIPSPEQ